jgi:hypothetical protein
MEILYAIGFVVIGFLFVRYVLPILLQLWEAASAIFVLLIVGAIVFVCVLGLFQN